MKQLESDRLEKSSLASEFKSKEGVISLQISKKRNSLNKITSNINSIIERIRIEEKLKVKAQKDAANLVKAEEKRAKQEEQKRQKLLDDAARKNGTLPVAPKTTNTDVAVKNTNRGAAKPLIDIAPETDNSNVLDFTTESKNLSSSFIGNKGRLPFPVDGGTIVTGFGSYTVPGTNLAFNNPGISIEGKVGAAVRCIFEGEISAVNVEGTDRYTVYIRHGKYITTYSNISGLAVNKGDKVTLGQQIGTMAANDDGDGAIEFILTESGAKTNKAINPTLWIRRK